MIESWDRLPEDLRELIAAEKSSPDPAPEVQARVFARVASTVGWVPGPTDLPTHGSMPGAPLGPSLARTAGRLSRRGIATFLVGAAVGGAAVGTVDHVRHGKQASAVVTPVAPVAPAALPSPEPVPAPAGASEGLPAAPAQRTAVASRPGARDKGLEAERKLVEMARTSLARGQTAAALAALRRHRRVFPEGQLAEERDSLWVAALVAQGDHAQARAQAARFQGRYPHSLFGPMVEQAIRSIP